MPCGCGEQKRPDLDPEVFPGYFENADGLWLFHRQWLAVPKHQETVGVVCISHGLGDHISRYEAVARRLNQQGYVVFGMDHQGHGLSEGVRAHVDDFHYFVRDFTAYVKQTRAECDPALRALPWFMVGHSMGGLIATHVVTSHDEEKTGWQWAGLALSGPAVEPDPANNTAFIRTIGTWLSSCLPKCGVAILSNTVANDPAILYNYLRDPVVFHGKVRARIARGILDHMDLLFGDDGTAKKIRVPLLVMQGLADVCVNPRGAKKLVDAAVNAPHVVYKTYEGQHHELLFDLRHRETNQDLFDFLKLDHAAAAAAFRRKSSGSSSSLTDSASAAGSKEDKEERLLHIEE